MGKGCAAPNMDGVMVDMDAPFGDQGADPMGDPLAGLDAALGGAMDEATDQGGGAGTPDMGVPPDAAAADAPMDALEAPEDPDMPPPDDPIV